MTIPLNTICNMFSFSETCSFSDLNPAYLPDLLGYILRIPLTTHCGSLKRRPLPSPFSSSIPKNVDCYRAQQACDNNRQDISRAYSRAQKKYVLKKVTKRDSVGYKKDIFNSVAEYTERNE